MYPLSLSQGWGQPGHLLGMSRQWLASGLPVGTLEPQIISELPCSCVLLRSACDREHCPEQSLGCVPRFHICLSPTPPGLPPPTPTCRDRSRQGRALQAGMEAFICSLALTLFFGGGSSSGEGRARGFLCILLGRQEGQQGGQSCSSVQSPTV